MRGAPAHLRTLRAGPTTGSALLGAVLGLLVVAPWTHGGHLLLLDWVSGPRQTLNPGVYGLDAGSLDAMPFRIGTQLLRHAVGAPATAWLLVWAYFPIAAGGVAALAGGPAVRRLVAAVVVCLNPFVVERVWAGHVAFLLGVALLPWILASAVAARRRGRWFAVRPAAWFALAVAISPHAAFLGGTLLLASMLLPRPGRRDVVRTVSVVAAAGLVYLYSAVVLVLGIRTISVTGADLEAYATRGGPGGLLVTVASLHGFWRPGPELPRDLLPGALAAALLVAVLVGVAAGLVLLVRETPDVGMPLAAAVAVGLLLGAGVHGPAGWLYRLLFDHVPLFEAMREQEKWGALLVVAYAVALGRVAERGRVLAGACLVPALVTAPVLLWGLSGSVHVSHYPASWAAAERRMGPGTPGVLFLPWHGYQPFPFTGGRTVATPAATFFSRPVLSSDAVELPQRRTDSVSRRTRYVDRLVARPGSRQMAGPLARLGVGWVVAAGSGTDAAYDLGAQRGLVPAGRWRDLTLWRVVPRAVTPRLHRTGPTSFHLDAGPAGPVVVPVEYSAGWRLDGRRGRPTPEGTVVLWSDGRAGDVVYAPWRWLRLASAGSGAALLGLLAAGLLAHRRELSGLRRRRRRSAASR